MSTKDDIRQALHDAIAWQEWLADCHSHCDDGIYKEAMDQAARYRKILKRRYGTAKTPLEQLADGATTVTLADIRRQISSTSSSRDA